MSLPAESLEHSLVDARARWRGCSELAALTPRHVRQAGPFTGEAGRIRRAHLAPRGLASFMSGALGPFESLDEVAVAH